jgi:hypothetical protein
VFATKEYSPPLSIIQGWLPLIPDLAVKVSPGVNLDELVDFDAEIEFISLGGALKEAVLWLGALKSTQIRAPFFLGFTPWLEICDLGAAVH